MSCPNCGNAVAVGVPACPHCNTRLVAGPLPPSGAWAPASTNVPQAPHAAWAPPTPGAYATPPGAMPHNPAAGAVPGAIPRSDRVFTGLPKSVGFGVAWLGTFAWFSIVSGLFSFMIGLGAGAVGKILGSDACIGSGCDEASNTLQTSAVLIAIAALATAGLGIFVLVSVVQMAFGDQRAVKRGFIGAMAICVTAFAMWTGFDEIGFGLFTACVLGCFALVGFGPFVTSTGKSFFQNAQRYSNPTG